MNQSRIRLRPKRTEDAAQDYAWARDPELCELEATFPVSIPYNDYLRIYRLELLHEPKGCQRFAIETTQGEHIGNCMCYQMDEDKGEAEVGILIGNRAYWNCGYGTEVMELLLGYVLASNPVERVYLHTLTWNLRAQRCFAKCGFSPCAEESRWGHRFVVMDIDRGRWQAHQKNADPPPQGEGGPDSAPQA